MRRTFVIYLATTALTASLYGCGPSNIEERREVVREERRDAADEALAEKRAQERNRAREADAAAAYREWLLHAERDTSLEHQTRHFTVQQVIADGTTLVLEISPPDQSVARDLCRFSVSGWTGRTDHGIDAFRVVSIDDGTVLAQSTVLPDGTAVCQ